MATIGNLLVKVGADLSDLRRGMSQAERVTQDFGRQLTGIGRSLTVGLTLPLTAVAAAAVKASVDMDSLRRGLEVAAGGAEEAAEQMAVMEEVARQPGLGFKEAIQGAIQLDTAFSQLSDTTGLANRSLSEFGNAVALTGGGKAELDRVIFQLGQIASAGKLLTQDLRPIIQTAPAVANALRNAFGTIDAQTINELGLSTEEFFNQLLDGLAEMPRAAAGARNAFENFTDAVFKARVAIGDKLLPVINPLIDGLTETLEGLEEVDSETIKWAISIGGVVAVLGPLTLALGAILTLLPSLTAGLGALAGVLSVSTGGLAFVIGAVVTGLGLLSAAFVKSKLDAAEAASAFGEASDQLIRLRDAVETTSGLGAVKALAEARVRLEAENAALDDALAKQEKAQEAWDAVARGGSAGAVQRAAAALEAADSSVVDAELNVALLGKTIGRLEQRVIDTGDELSLLFEETEAGANQSRVALEANVETLGALMDRIADLKGDIRDLELDTAVSAGGDALTSLNEKLGETRAELARVEAAANRVAEAIGGVAAPEISLVGTGQLEPATIAATMAPTSSVGQEITNAIAKGLRFEDLSARAQDYLAAQHRLQINTQEFAESVANATDEMDDVSLLSFSGAMAAAEDGLGALARGFGQTMESVVAALNPIALIATVLDEAIREAVRAFEPLIDAIGPLVARIGDALHPAMEALVPVVENLAPIIAAVTELFAGAIVALAPLLEFLADVLKVAVGALTFFVQGLGLVIEALGHLVDFIISVASLGFNRDNIGDDIEDFGKTMQRAAKDSRRALSEDLAGSASDTADSLDRVNQTSTNLPTGFKMFNLALRRFQAQDALNAPGPIDSSGSRGSGPVTNNNSYTFNIEQRPGEDGEELARRVVRVFQERQLRVAGTPRLGLAGY